MTPPENVRPLLDYCLGEKPRAALRLAARYATDAGLELYLVGGSVRDLLLGQHPTDLDLVAVGDAPALARAVAAATNARWVEHDRFGTATVWLPDGVLLDFTTARAETYPRPGSLPEVRPGTLADDLARRDFACNAIALRLDGDAWGNVIDPLSGLDDIDRGRIRVLHDRSFRDDPTRLFRAVRYAGRLGFTLDASTSHLLHRDISSVRSLSPDRTRHEVEAILEERYPERILSLAHEVGLLRQLHPLLTFDEDAATALRRAFAIAPDEVNRAALGIALLGWGFDEAVVHDLMRTLNPTVAEASALTGTLALHRNEGRWAAAELSASAVTAMLAAYPLAAVVVCAARSESQVARERALLFLNTWRHVRPHLNGNDLMTLGVQAGPELGGLLRQLRDARIDGRVQSVSDERELVARWLQSRIALATKEDNPAIHEEGPTP